MVISREHLVAITISYLASMQFLFHVLIHRAPNLHTHNCEQQETDKRHGIKDVLLISDKNY